MVQSQVSVKLQYVPIPAKVNWDPLLKADKRGTQRKIKKLCKCLPTPDGEVFYEVEVEGHDLDSYYTKIIANKYGYRGSCHCKDFIHRKLPEFRYNGKGSWCKHLLIALMAIQDLEQDALGKN